MINREDSDGAIKAIFENYCAARWAARNTAAMHPAWLDLAGIIYSEFIARNLSPDGSADLPAGTLFVSGAMRLEVSPTSAEKGDGATY